MTKEKTKTETLLVEVRTEELPPPAVSLLAHRFPQALLKLLAAQGFAESDATCSDNLATPRRFAALINNVRATTTDINIKRRGPQVKDCYDDGGKPSKALAGFMRAVGEVNDANLGRESDNGKDYIIWQGIKPGIALGAVLAQMVSDSLGDIGELPTMRWNDEGYAFVRPVRGIIMLHGKEVIGGKIMGITASNQTRGHPAMANRNITIANAGEYEKTLRRAKVIVNYDKRVKKIYYDDNFEDHNFYCATLTNEWENIEKMDAVITEAAAMCEYPSVCHGEIDEEFWQLPPVCVATCIIVHQKSVPYLEPADGAEAVRGFYFIADNAPKNSQSIINGINAVVRARLRDMDFYFRVDENMSEDEARQKLGGIVYHQKLGSQKQRAERIIKLAAAIGKVMNLSDGDMTKLRRAAEVCKLDLPTMMVGEYPELAGTMAALYFVETTPLRAIVVRHGDNDFCFGSSKDPVVLPSVALFLADKLEKIVGMFAVGEKPEGRKDPHGLRRAAGQIADVLASEFVHKATGKKIGGRYERITNLSVTELIMVAFEVFAGDGKQGGDAEEVREFIVRRISLPEINAEVQNAVNALRPDYLAQIPHRCQALQNFLPHPQAAVLIAANKRINNILRKSPAADASFSPDLLQEDAEKALHKCITGLEEQTKQLTAKGDYEDALKLLAEAAAPIGAFFDKCMVNADDANLRNNRLALLARLRAQLNIVADLSML